MKASSNIEQLRNIINQELKLLLPQKSSIADLLVQIVGIVDVVGLGLCVAVHLPDDQGGFQA